MTNPENSGRSHSAESRLAQKTPGGGDLVVAERRRPAYVASDLGRFHTLHRVMGNGVLSYRYSNIDGAGSRCRMVMPLKARRTESLRQPR